MADDVISTGGQGQIAQEDTLQRLLSAVEAQGGLGTAGKAAQLAAQAGIKNADEALKNVADSAAPAAGALTRFGTHIGRAGAVASDLAAGFKKADEALGPFIKQLLDGTAQSSDLWGAFSKLPGVLGQVASVFQKVAQFQESNLKAYQNLTNSGVNFGGALLNMRQAALDTYMSFEDFQKVITANSESLVKLGGSANEGAASFVKLSNNLLKSELGTELRSLGFTTTQVNEGMLNYLATTGGRTKKELQNSEQIFQGTKAYLEQLDRLSEVTGKSREQQEKELKQAMFEADVQQTMARMGVKEREAFQAAMLEAGNLAGQAGKDVVLARAQGRAVSGEAGKLLTATGGRAAEILGNLQNVAKQYGTDSKEFKDASNAARLEMQQNFSKIPAAVFSVNDSFKKIGDASKLAAQDTMAGLTSKEAFDEAEKKRQEEIEKRKKGEAAAAVEAQKAVQEMSQSLMKLLTPAIQVATEITNNLTKVFGGLISTAGEYSKVTTALLGVLGAYLIANKAKKAWDTAQAAGEGLGGAKDVLIGKRGDSALKPLYVFVVNDMPDGLGRGGRGGRTPPRPTPAPPAPGAPPRPTPAPPAPPAEGTGKIGKLAGAGRLALGGAGALAGVGLDYAADAVGRDTVAGKGLDTASSTAQGAAMGMMFGPMGALIGGGLGLGYGLYKNIDWKKMFGGEEAPPGDGKPTQDIPKLAEGGIVTRPTLAMIGEGGGKEAVLPLDRLKSMLDSLSPMAAPAKAVTSTISDFFGGKSSDVNLESLKTELQTLNIQTASMIEYLKETAEYTRKGVDATRSLNGDFFKF